jgi:hypothetical protein
MIMIAIGFIIFWGGIIALLVAEVSRHNRIINYNKAIALKYKAKQQTFIKTDNVDGQWLSPVPTERAWQEEKLVEIFGHYPTASPKWQYMNGLIQNSLDAKQMYSEEEVIQIVLDLRFKVELYSTREEINEWFEQFFKKK